MWQSSMYGHMAEMLHGIDQYEKGLEYVERSIDMGAEPALSLRLSTKAKILADMGRLDEAAACCDEWVEAIHNERSWDDKSTSDAYSLKGEVLLTADRHAESIRLCRTALQMDPENEHAADVLKDALAGSGRRTAE